MAEPMNEQSSATQVPYECRMGVHAYTEIETLDSDGPMAIVCTKCNRTWRVMAEDRPARMDS